eukprot:jgi/Ulvmu1/11176/UM072_0012.1
MLPNQPSTTCGIHAGSAGPPATTAACWPPGNHRSVLAPARVKLPASDAAAAAAAAWKLASAEQRIGRSAGAR